MLIFPPLFLYATESFTRVAISFLILFEVFIFTFAMAILFFPVYPPVGACCIVMSVLLVLSIAIYSLVIAIKSLIDTDIHIIIVVVITNLAVGFCSGCISCIPTVGAIFTQIFGIILGGIDYYVFFYMLQNQVNPVSLLLFWTDLWFVLMSIYSVIETFIVNGEVEGAEVEFDLGNYVS